MLPPLANLLGKERHGARKEWDGKPTLKIGTRWEKNPYARRTPLFITFFTVITSVILDLMVQRVLFLISSSFYHPAY
jgi:hypothetical protein